MKLTNCLLSNMWALLLFGSSIVGMSGALASPRSHEPREHQRGWIGGEYKIVSVLPPELKHQQRPLF